MASRSIKRTQGVAALVVGVLIVLALLAVFAVELTENQASSRRNLETQAHERARIVSGLIGAVFDGIARVGQPQSTNAGAAQNVRNRSAYAALLNGRGHVLGHSAGFTAQARAGLMRSGAVRKVADGLPWALGNVHAYGSQRVVDLVVGDPGPHGRAMRATGVPLSLLSLFVGGELSRVPGLQGHHQLLLDGHGVVVGSTVAARPAGYVFHTAAQRHELSRAAGVVHAPDGMRYFDRVPLANSDWHLILSIPEGQFYASVSGARRYVPWLIFAAFGLVALLALVLVRRSIAAADRVRVANERLTAANAELAAARGRLVATNDALARSNQELERRAHELVRSNRELDQFASIASHDLQEPLRKVRTFTERVAETESERLSDRGGDYLRRANSAAERMQTLIEDLLRYSRVSTRGQPFEPVDLRALTAEVVDDLSELVSQTGAEVHIGALPTLNADESQMRQLMQNLISNALKFRREGVAPRVEIDGALDSGWATITVRDNGIGFDAEYSGRIFRVFERLHGRGAYPGTGIGLALCRKIAERHGGTIVADAVPGEGAVFTVTLQTQRTEAVTDAPSSGGGAATSDEEPYVTA